MRKSSTLCFFVCAASASREKKSKNPLTNISSRLASSASDLVIKKSNTNFLFFQNRRKINDRCYLKLNCCCSATANPENYQGQKGQNSALRLLQILIVSKLAQSVKRLIWRKFTDQMVSCIKIVIMQGSLHCKNATFFNYSNHTQDKILRLM